MSSSFTCQAVTRPLKLLGAGALTALLVGCAGLSAPSTGNNLPSTSAQAQSSALNAQIDAALTRVANQPRWASSMDDRAAFASFAGNAINVSYQGSAADLLTAVAAARGKTFKLTGPAPHMPLFVFVETKDQPFEEFLRDLDKQFGQRADVVLSDTHLELRYR